MSRASDNFLPAQLVLGGQHSLLNVCIWHLRAQNITPAATPLSSVLGLLENGLSSV